MPKSVRLPGRPKNLQSDEFRDSPVNPNGGWGVRGDDPCHYRSFNDVSHAELSFETPGWLPVSLTRGLNWALAQLPNLRLSAPPNALCNLPFPTAVVHAAVRNVVAFKAASSGLWTYPLPGFRRHEVRPIEFVDLLVERLHDLGEWQFAGLHEVREGNQ